MNALKNPRANNTACSAWWSALPGCVVLGLILQGCVTSKEHDHHHSHPEVPVPDGNEFKVRFAADGVQIYVWSGTNWAFRAPEAKLLDAQGKVVGNHKAGPTWESFDGSKVTGKVITSSPAYVSDSIPHLLLKATSAPTPGVFASLSYIQRVDTVGGKPPDTAGSFVGQEIRVNYTAQYLFYRSARH